MFDNEQTIRDEYLNIIKHASLEKFSASLSKLSAVTMENK